MDAQTQKKIFEPFFTTKDVGEGTGLGMSIAYNTIKKHNGTINVDSLPGQGTEFILQIPINFTEG
jgi:two-component system, NtrC family, sensor kinase